MPSDYLETADRAGEMSLFQQLFTEAKVYLGPGSMFSCKVPGWFRIVFAVTPERWDTINRDFVLRSQGWISLICKIWAKLTRLNQL